MEFWAIVDEISNNSNMSLVAISKKIGRSSGFLSASKARNSLPLVSTACDIVGACDYALCVVPRNDVNGRMFEVTETGAIDDQVNRV